MKKAEVRSLKQDKQYLIILFLSPKGFYYFDYFCSTNKTPCGNSLHTNTSAYRSILRGDQVLLAASWNHLLVGSAVPAAAGCGLRAVWQPRFGSG